MPSQAEINANLKLEYEVMNMTFGRCRDYFKEDETSSKVLAHLSAPFNPKYMDLSTTRGKHNIYWKKGVRKEVEKRTWWVFKMRAHEGQHMWDWKRLGILFPLGYALPHIVALLFLFVFAFKLWGLASVGSLVAGLALGYAFPRNKAHFFTSLACGVGGCVTLGITKTGYWSLWMLPVALLISPGLNFVGAAFFRAWIEFRGYTITMAVNYWKHGRIKPETVDWITEHFTGDKYYFMLPWKRYVRWRLKRNIERIENGRILERPWASTVYDVMRNSGMSIIKYGDNS